MDRIKFLAEEIVRHDFLYWSQNSPEISDMDYDALVEELKALDPDNPVLHKVYGVGAGGKVKHLNPMKSLDKCYTTDELRTWATGVARSPAERLFCAPKYDGISAEVQPNGTISTRGGDGEEGEDITHLSAHIPFLIGAPDEPKPWYGEVLMYKSVFEANRDRLISPSTGAPYKNTRAAAAGIARNAGTDGALKSLLTFVSFKREQEVFELSEFDDIDWDAALADCKDKDVPTDGLVIGLVDRKYGESLGETEHHPLHSLAYKYRNPATTTTIVDVIWQSGKGRISPVAILDPVELSGVTISKATLHNMDFIKQMGVQIGDVVEIQRMGDVIPGIAQVIEPGAERVEIVCTECPSCGGEAALDGQDYKCLNPDCRGTKGKQLRDSLVRLDIDNIGPGTVAKLVDAGVDDIVKVFHAPHELWASLPGVSQSVCRVALSSRKAKPCEDYRLLATLNIPGIGITLAKRVMDRFNIAELMAATAEQLCEVEGFDMSRASEVAAGVAAAKGILFGLIEILPVVETKGMSSRPTVCFTGADETPRNEWFAMAKKAGWEPRPRVTKDLTALVCASADSQSTKAKTARKYGTTVMSYADFRRELSYATNE